VARYAVRLVAGAKRELHDTPERMAKRIRRALHQLAEDPRPPGAKLPSGARAERIWRLRVGDYRILYELRDEHLLVLVVRIGHRSVVYRRLPGC